MLVYYFPMLSAADHSLSSEKRQHADLGAKMSGPAFDLRSTSFGWKYATRKKVIDHHNAAHDTNFSIISPSEKAITFTYAKAGSICDNKAFQMENPRARPSLYCFISTSEFVCAMLIP